MPNERTEYLERSAKSADGEQKPGNERNFRIGRYDFLVLQLENRVREANEAKAADTGIIEGIGDWIGEKTGAYETGKAAYARVVERAAQDARKLHAELAAEFARKDVAPSEAEKIASISKRLQKLSESELQNVGWADAAFNTVGGKEVAPVRYAVRTLAGAAEGAYEGVAWVAEMTGKFLWTLAVYSLEPQARQIVEGDVEEFVSRLTPENAEKFLSALPKALEEFQKLPADEQIEGASKLIGAIAVPLGVWAKAVRAGKSVADGGIKIAKVGVEKIAKGGRGAAIGVAMVVGGTSQTALAEAGIVAGAAVRYVGEMGGWRAKKPEVHHIEAPTAKTPDTGAEVPDTRKRFEEELAKAERAVEEAASSWDRLTALMRRDIALEKARPGSVPPMQLKMASEAISRWDEAMKLPKGGPRETAMSNVRMTFEKIWTQEALRNHTAKTVAENAIAKASKSSKGELDRAREAARQASLETKMAKSEARSGIPRETVYANAALEDADRLSKTEAALGRKLSDSEGQAVLKAHNTGEKKVYETLPSELRAKAKILDSAGFDRTERETIVRNGLAGKPELKWQRYSELPLPTPRFEQYLTRSPKEVKRLMDDDLAHMADSKSNFEAEMESVWLATPDHRKVEAIRFANTWIGDMLQNVNCHVRYLEHPGRTELLTLKNAYAQDLYDGLNDLYARIGRSEGRDWFVLTERNGRILQELAARLEALGAREIVREARPAWTLERIKNWFR